MCAMTYDDLISYFGDAPAAAAARHLDRQLLFGWKKRGRIPLGQQIQYELATGGALKADLPQRIRRGFPVKAKS